jgi:N-acetylmuramoyl-L-alanine amidase
MSLRLRAGSMRNEFVRRLVMIAMLLLVCGTVVQVRSAEARKLVVFSPITTYSIDVIVQKGSEYIGLVELLEPLGHVEAKPDGKNFVLQFTNGQRTVAARFRDGKKDVELPGGKMNLHKSFFAVGSRGYVPLENLQELVAQITGMQTQVHLATKHLYLGGVGIHYSSELKKNPTKLVLSFTAPVAPTITNEGNAMKLVFTRDPVLSSGTDLQDFKDSAIQSTTFAETSGGSELIVHASSPMVATSSDGGKTLTIGLQSDVKAAPAPVATAPTPPPSVTPLPNPTMPKPAAPATPARPSFLVVIDAAHGGEDTGATLASNIIEKELTLTIARRIAHELQNRGIQVSLLRNSDVAISSEQRAATVNTSHASVYVSVHASSIGHGLRIFTSLMPPSTTVPGRRAFVPWNAAQLRYLERSTAVSGSIAYECARKQLAVRALQGAVLPLNNIATAAVALELAPAGAEITTVATTEYIDNIAAAVANGIAAVRATEGEKRP